MNFLPEKKYGVPSHNFVKKNVLFEKGDEITRFDRRYSGPHLSVLNKNLCRTEAKSFWTVEQERLVFL
jgi:hypothetical protein